MENEKKTSLYSRVLACVVALLLLCPFVGLFFFKPSVHVKADAGDFGSVLDYGIKEFIGAGFTVADASNTSFAIALGSQLMLWMISEQVAEERATHPGASWNFSDFKGLTGWYRKQVDVDAGITKVYPMTFMFTDTTGNHAYPAMDGGLECIKCADFSCKFFPTGYPTQIQASLTTGNVQIVAGGINADGFSLQAFGYSGNFWNPDSYYAGKTGWNPYLFLRFNTTGIGSAPVYQNTNDMSIWASINNASNGRQFMSIGSSDTNSVLTQNLPQVEVTPENLPTIYDTYIVPNYPPEYLVFPDGWPSEDPTEDTTEDTTGSGNDNQPFTLPPEWLQDYTFPVETWPTIPFTDVEPPSIDEDLLDGFSDGMNFWWYLCKDIIDALDLEDFIALCFALAVLFFILWRLGSGGGGSGGDE